MSNLRVFVEVSDNYLWTLKPFSYLFNIYWSSLQPVVVAGYNRPDFRLPDNFQFYQISQQNYPADMWSNGMLEFLKAQDDEHFVFLLCDYWLCRTVDIRGVNACYDYIKNRPRVLRIDLTDDRQYAGGVVDVDYWGNYDIVETPFGTPYQMSLQAGIWNKNNFVNILPQKFTAWETEINIQPTEALRVLGTRQRPVRYANAVLKGEIDNNQLRQIPQEHYEYIKQFIPEGWKNDVE